MWRKKIERKNRRKEKTKENKKNKFEVNKLFHMFFLIYFTLLHYIKIK